MSIEDKYVRARHLVAEIISEVSTPSVKAENVVEDRTGPLGGVSDQVTLWATIDGDLVPVRIAIYSDDTIAEALRREILEAQARTEYENEVQALPLDAPRVVAQFFLPG